MDPKQRNRNTIRNSNTEILRIIAMLMIIASHYSFHGVIDFSKIDNSLNYLLLKGLTLGNLGVDIFILMFGYYSILSERVVFQKLFLLWSQVFTYSVLIFCGLVGFGIVDFSLKNLVKSVLPTIFSKYWFFTAYIVFSLLVPFINKFLRLLNKKEYEHLLVVMLVMWGVIPTLFSQIPAGDSFVLFLLLYSLGGYFRLYPENILNCKKWGSFMIGISA